MEAACVRDYHTFVWSSVPEGVTDGSPIHTSVQFQGTREGGKPGGTSKGVEVWKTVVGSADTESWDFHRFRDSGREGTVEGH